MQGRTVSQIAGVCAMLDDKSVRCWGQIQSYKDETFRGDQPNEMGNNLPAVELGTVRVLHVCCRSGEYCCSNGECVLQPNEMGNNLPAVKLGTVRANVRVLHVCCSSGE